MKFDKTNKDDLLREIERLQQVVFELQKVETARESEDNYKENAVEFHEKAMDKRKGHG